MLAYIWLSAFLAIAQRESLTLARTSATTVGPTVKLDYGTFTGEVNETTKIISFRGIRYADAPLGDLRWRAPISPPSLQLGEVNATEFGNSCIQTPQSTVLSGFSEDCLFGNVYVPANTSTGSNLPILVWFHGGGFQEGDTHDAPPELILHSSVKPLIFVSFEYRLGQFGFLGGSRIAANGALNVGLLDQRAALRWVQRYISKFGGDPSLVTIWGESAGAGSTMFHLLANGGDNEGLFRAAMGDSPSLNYMPFFDEPYDEEIFDQFAALAGCMGSDEMTLECLRSANSSVLTAAGSQLITSRPATLFVFAPILDGVLLRERPVEAFADGHFSQVPVLFGSNTDEGANWSASLADPNANTSMPNATEQTVFNFLQGQYANMTEASMNKAIMHYPLRSFASSFSLQGQQMYGEARYICTAVMITGSASRQRLPAYHFHYDNPDLGSNHGADLQAFFQPLPADASPADSALFVAMREMWTSFVTSGVPTASREISWLPATNSNGSPRILLHPGGIQMEDVDETLSTRCDFWHSLDMQLHT